MKCENQYENRVFLHIKIKSDACRVSIPSSSFFRRSASEDRWVQKIIPILVVFIQRCLLLLLLFFFLVYFPASNDCHRGGRPIKMPSKYNRQPVLVCHITLRLRIFLNVQLVCIIVNATWEIMSSNNRRHLQIAPELSWIIPFTRT